MRAWYCHHFVLPLPSEHRFPMDKYARLHARVANHQSPVIQLAEPEPASDADLARVHCPDYIAAVCSGTLAPAAMRRIGFPWSAALVERSRRSSGGTIAALLAALGGDGVAMNLAGGTHHAGYAGGGGYCVFNDAVIAARRAQAEGRAERLLIVDLDVHQGDGTAELCADDPSIFTFSMHAARNYPAVKPQSDIDVALADATDDARYLDTLAHWLPQAIERARPDAIIYLAGADPFVGDRLGYLALSKPGLAQRDRFVLRAAHAHGLPIAVCMAGGYADDIDDIVDIHFATVLEALAVAESPGRPGHLPARA